MVKGKGKGKANTEGGGKAQGRGGATHQPNNTPPAQGGRGYTEMLGKDGQTRRIPADRLRICRDFATTGKCDKPGCKFPHVTGLPKALADKAMSPSGLLL